jgi:hypothetical protein
MVGPDYPGLTQQPLTTIGGTADNPVYDALNDIRTNAAVFSYGIPTFPTACRCI